MPAKLIIIYCVNYCCDWHKQTFSSNQVQLCCYTSTAPEPAVVQCVLLLWTCWCCYKGWWWRSVVWWGAGVEQLAALLSIGNTEQVIWLVTVLTEAVVTQSTVSRIKRVKLDSFVSKPVSLAHSPHPGWSHEHDTNIPVFYNKPGPFLIKLLLPTDCEHPVCNDI